jgi:hypothetical protein
MTDDLPPLLSSLWQPAHFYLARGLRCAWQFEAEQTLPWELFRGRLLEPRQTRESRTFLAWNIFPVIGDVVGTSPLLSLLLDEAGKSIHVTRGVLSRVWRAIDAAGGIESEQVEEWVRELVGTLRADDFASREMFVTEVQILIGHAVVGTSRLPLTSLEAPLPQFTFGQFAYVPRTSLEGIDARVPRRHWPELLTASPDQLGDSGRAKLLEILLRSTDNDEVPVIAAAFADWAGAPRLGLTFRRLFNDVSLSPYTDFVRRAIALLSAWSLPEAEEIDVLTALLRQITRHLTAYDLVLFHYRGANFPDALLLDALLGRLVQLAETRREVFLEASPAGRLRRRAVRMGCLARVHYEGHAVPDQPTSPGENSRVFPEPFGRVPDEQIEQPQRRTRHLFEEATLTSLLTTALREILTQACRDLAEPAELREGGIGLFIDRPLGFFKAPAEIDQTPLVSYEAFSRRLATRRLIDGEQLATRLALDVAPAFWQECRERLAELQIGGLSVERVPESPRPAVSLADARKVADDFVVLRTTPRSLREFWDALGVEPGPWPLVARVRNDAGQPVMMAWDAAGCAVAEFDADWSQGSLLRGGVEIPRKVVGTFRGPAES